jgi:hypothetical protein
MTISAARLGPRRVAPAAALNALDQLRTWFSRTSQSRNLAAVHFAPIARIVVNLSAHDSTTGHIVHRSNARSVKNWTVATKFPSKLISVLCSTNAYCFGGNTLRSMSALQRERLGSRFRNRRYACRPRLAARHLQIVARRVIWKEISGG